jgi:hypothetical protein
MAIVGRPGGQFHRSHLYEVGLERPDSTFPYVGSCSRTDTGSLFTVYEKLSPEDTDSQFPMCEKSIPQGHGFTRASPGSGFSQTGIIKAVANRPTSHRGLLDWRRIIPRPVPDDVTRT